MSLITRERVFLARRSVLRMLRNREYAVNEEELNLTYQDFTDKYSEASIYKSLEFSACKIGDMKDQVIVFFPEVEALKPTNLKDLLMEMQDKDFTHSIVVTRTKPTGKIHLALERIPTSMRIELFFDEELLVDITEYHLVPQHTVLDSAAAEAVLQKLHIDRLKLPRMKLADPISKYYGCQRGDIVKVVRKSDSAGRALSYRVVL